MSLGWGLVGLGRIAGREIAPAIQALDGSFLAAVAARDGARAFAFARAFGAARTHDSYAQLLADPAVDVVYVATPNALHADQVVAAAQAGKHVLCDKPLATNASDAERAVAACADAGVRLGVMFQTRFHEGFAEIERLLREGAIGDVVLAEIEIGAGFGALDGWRADPALAGLGTLNNQGIHGVDLLRFLLGAEVVEVVALACGAPVESVATVLARLHGGALAYLHSSHSLPQPRNDVVLRGTRGSIVARGLSRAGADGTIAVRRGETETVAPASSRGAYGRALAAFARAVVEDRAPSPSGDDGLRAALVLDAIAASLRSGALEPVQSGVQRVISRRSTSASPLPCTSSW